MSNNLPPLSMAISAHRSELVLVAHVLMLLFFIIQSVHKCSFCSDLLLIVCMRLNYMSHGSVILLLNIYMVFH